MRSLSTSSVLRETFLCSCREGRDRSSCQLMIELREDSEVHLVGTEMEVLSERLLHLSMLAVSLEHGSNNSTRSQARAVTDVLGDDTTRAREIGH